MEGGLGVRRARDVDRRTDALALTRRVVSREDCRARAHEPRADSDRQAEDWDARAQAWREDSGVVRRSRTVD